MLVQLNDCTCLGYNQIFECTVYGGGITIWRGTALSGCQPSDNETQLRHSQYRNSQATGECVGGEIVARSVGVSGNCYTSQLSLAVGEENLMINETFECVHRSIYHDEIIIGKKTLNLTLDGKQSH